MRKKSSCWIFLLGGGILGCLVIAALAFFYFNNIRNQEIPTIPLVFIQEVIPEGTVVTNQPVIVYGQAQDPDGIAEVQLWVNGEMVASQTNPGQDSELPFDISQAWIPTGAGNYLFVLYAIDGKEYVGQSEPVTIQAAERFYSYEVVAGDTVDTIANDLGTTPEDIRDRNPGIEDEPTPGTSIYVPPAPPSEGGEDAEEEDVPRVDPPVPIGTPGDETPADPASPPWWSYLPLPETLYCMINPAGCAVPLGGGEGLPPPINVVATLEDPCGVVISWEDASENELGFNIYRTRIGTETDPELVALLRASPGSGGRLSYMDERPPFGSYVYAVTAYNEIGEYWSPPSEEVEILCLSVETPDTISVSVEVFRIMVYEPFDRLYCYVSLAGSPFERVPHGSSFIELVSGNWNIADHFTGSNRRTVRINRSTPLEIQAECLGWQGANLINLGRFTRSHPPGEWDGRTLTASPPEGSINSFHVNYRINPTEPEEYETGSFPDIIDPSYPPPYNLRDTESWQRCREAYGGRIMCDEVREPGLTWDYITRADWRHTFRVYVRMADEITPRPYYDSFRGFKFAPQSNEDCNTTAYYSVSAVVGTDLATGESVVTPPSREWEVGPSCSQLEITLLTLWSYRAQDHFTCNVFSCQYWDEAYGWLNFNGRGITWNNHCDGSCLTSGPGVTNILEHGTLVQWENEYLNIGSGFGYNNNVFRVPIRDGQGLYVQYKFMDHDDLEDDDFWCGSEWGRRAVTVLEARSPAEWLLVDQDITLEGNEMNSKPNPNCQITFHVRGVP